MPLGRISFDIKSSLFVKELEKRIAMFGNKPHIGYTIVVPDDLCWLTVQPLQSEMIVVNPENSGKHSIESILSRARKGRCNDYRASEQVSSEIEALDTRQGDDIV